MTKNTAKPNKLEKILVELGLTENEARVYFAALSLGPATVLRIASAAETKRTTVYSVVESLKQKGLMAVEVRGFKKLYTAENPEKLESMLETRRERFRTALPEFAALYNLKGGESFIKYYEGLEAVKSVYEGLIRDVRSHEDYLIISDQQQWMGLDEKYFKNFVERRAKLNINIRLLLQDSESAREAKKFERNYNETIKILPPKTALTTNLVIIPRRIVIHQLIPPVMAIVVENKSVIQLHRELFEIIWNSISV